MNDRQYLILAYVIGLGVLWGYALLVWAGMRRAAPRDRSSIS